MLTTGFQNKTALSAALLLGALVSLPASAATVSTTTFPLPDLVGTTVSISNNFGSMVDSFVDTYTFSLSETSQSLGTTVTFSVSLGDNSFALSNMTLTLMDGLTVLGSDSQAVSGNTLSVNTLLGAGTGYSFVVAGDVTGTLGGSYAGLVAAVPIPEAETYAMMLAGLGLVGFMVRRRSRLAA